LIHKSSIPGYFCGRFADAFRTASIIDAVPEQVEAAIRRQRKPTMRIAIPGTASELLPRSISSVYAHKMGPAGIAYSQVGFGDTALSLWEFGAAWMITPQINGCQLCCHTSNPAHTPAKPL